MFFTFIIITLISTIVGIIVDQNKCSPIKKWGVIEFPHIYMFIWRCVDKKGINYALISPDSGAYLRSHLLRISKKKPAFQCSRPSLRE